MRPYILNNKTFSSVQIDFVKFVFKGPRLIDQARTTILLHYKCRNSNYFGDPNIRRFNVPDDKVKWVTQWPEYTPLVYSSPILETAEWADINIIVDKSRILNFNKIDGNIDRTSFMQTYNLDINGLPMNPIGRTGIQGRGVLGKWGPNHAADPIVTRWKRLPNGEKQRNPVSQKPILQFVAIKRRDTEEWAIPGGMVDAGEDINQTLKREFSEEALNSNEVTPEEKEIIRREVAKVFQHGTEIYRGYVDDPRNTDNAWMETVAMNYHDESGNGIGKFNLQAGDDAKAVCWKDIDSSLELYANHKEFIKLTCQKLEGHF